MRIVCSMMIMMGGVIKEGKEEEEEEKSISLRESIVDKIRKKRRHQRHLKSSTNDYDVLAPNNQTEND